MRLPKFETPRLFLRPRTMMEFESCLAMDRDPEVTRFVAGPWNDHLQHESFLRDRIQRSMGEGLGYWSIFPKQVPTQFLGWVMLIPQDGVGPEIEIGWRLNRCAWGHGYATEAARHIVRHAFQCVGLQRIVADIHPGNVASIRVAEKIGLRFYRDVEQGGFPHKSYVMTQDDIRPTLDRDTSSRATC